MRSSLQWTWRGPIRRKPGRRFRRIAGMTEPTSTEIDDVLELVHREGLRYLASIDDDLVRRPGAEDTALGFDGNLPEVGAGAVKALTEILDHGMDAAVRSSGPRMFHFVTGGVTPAALAGDWLASLLDQNSFSWVGSPLGSRLEAISLSWLKELFGLPSDWGGVLTSGATMANFSALAAARHWWGEQHGVDVEDHGLAGLPPMPVLSSGYIHPSAVKALAMLGVGRTNVQRFAKDDVGRLNLAGLKAGLEGHQGAALLIVANAGEVNAGDFDPISDMIELARSHNAWVHVDGAFGLFARVAPRAAAQAAGVEEADSVIADGHKWLNVPYDCGFAFVRDPLLLAKSFTAGAAYLPSSDEPHPNFGYLGPDMSRRARSFATWATLRAYGRAGYRAMVERHLELATHLGERVQESNELELLAPVQLNIVCFRYRPEGLTEEELNDLNNRIGEAIIEDGRIYVGSTRYAGKVALRPAIVNWRTTTADVDLVADVVLELGKRLR